MSAQKERVTAIRRLRALAAAQCAESPALPAAAQLKHSSSSVTGRYLDPLDDQLRTIVRDFVKASLDSLRSES